MNHYNMKCFILCKYHYLQIRYFLGHMMQSKGFDRSISILKKVDDKEIL